MSFHLLSLYNARFELYVWIARFCDLTLWVKESGQYTKKFIGHQSDRVIIERTMQDNQSTILVQSRQLEVESEQVGQRVDNFLFRYLKGVPKTRIYKMIRKGEVRVNKGRIKPTYKLQMGDWLRIPPVRISEVEEPPRVKRSFADEIERAILYEDKRLMVVNKPSGLAVHGGSGIKLGLIEILRQIKPNEKTLELVHRLDRDTSGCIMVAKKRSMLTELHKQLREGQVNKEYLLLVAGRWPRRKNEIDAPLEKNVLNSGERMVRVSPSGKASVTRYELLQYYEGYSLIRAKPITGRTHQIRVHCQYAGFPILGDQKYGDDEANKRVRKLGLSRLFLHAHRLVLSDTGQEMPHNFEAPLDSDLQRFLKNITSS